MTNRRDLILRGGALALAGGPPAAAEAGWRRLATETFKGKQDDIAFVSPQVGWYGNCEGRLYRTLDGGETWSRVWDRPGTFIRALGFVDERVGFLGNVGTDYYPGVSDTQPLYRTTDGGTSWTPVEADGMRAVKGICGIDILRQTRIHQGERRETVLIHAAGRVGGPAMIVRSSDGGASWRVIDLSRQAGMILDVKFFDVRNGLVCAATSDDLARSNALILRTQDGGATWTEAYRSARPFETTWKMSFPSRRAGYATVQNYAEGASRRVVRSACKG